jgi:hypothetical protein
MMLVDSYRFIVFLRSAVFTDPGMQGIDVDAKILGYQVDRFSGFVRQLDH